MSLRRLARDTRPLKVSFEFSPPKTDEAEEKLWQAIRRLEPLQPAFVSVTYGAGGSTRDRTHTTVKRIVEETSLSPAAHLTCVAHTKGEIDEIVRGYWDAGIKHIVALRGDMPGMQGKYQAHPDGYASTPELIEGIRKIAPFEISVSAYPERHPDSASGEQDIELLKAKVDAGATRALTQFGFDTEALARFRDRVVNAGHRRADRARHHPDDEHQRHFAHGQRRGRVGAGLAGTASMTASTAMPTRASSSPPPCSPSRCRSCAPTASTSFISIRSTRPT